MKTKVQHLEPCKKRLEIEIPPNVVLRKFDEVYSQIAKSARIPGFRQGKAPRELLEKYHANLAKEEVLKDLIPTFYHKAVKEADLVPVSLPEISDVQLETKGPLFFRAIVEVRPEVKIKSYRKLRLRRNKLPVNEDDIDKSLKALQEANAEFKTVGERAVRKEDYLICDYEFIVEGKLIEEKKNHWLLVEDSKLIPGFGLEQIIGAMPGDIREIRADLPENFFKPEYAKKPATLRVNIKEIKEKNLPQLDDEFARDLGEFQNLDELKSKIREDLKKRYEFKEKEDLREQIVDQLLKASSLSLPSSLVRAQTDRLKENARSQILKSGFKEEEINSRQKELDERLRLTAERQLKMSFILEKIAQIENIRVSDEELEKDIELIAQKLNREMSEVKRDLEEKALLDGLRQQLLEEKVLEFLLQEVEVS
jgi:trigger factor